jgi:hypothetical protein
VKGRIGLLVPVLTTALASCHVGDPSPLVERPSVHATLPSARPGPSKSAPPLPAVPAAPAASTTGTRPLPTWSPLSVDCAAPAPAKREKMPRSPRWTALRTGLTTNLVAVWGSGPGDVWMADDQGTILRTRDGGATFSRCTVPGAPDLTTIWGSGVDDVWMLGRERLLHATAGGTRWSQLEPGDHQAFSSGWGTSANDVWLVTEGLPDQWVLRSSDGGASWSGLSPAPYASALWGTSASDLWIDSGFFVSRSTDGGATWIRTGPQPETEEGFVIRGSASDDIWILGTGGTLVFSADHGATWRGEASSARVVYDLWSAGHGFAWATGGGVVARLGKAPWVNEVDREVSVSRVWGTSPKDVWAVGPGGLVLHRP